MGRDEQVASIYGGDVAVGVVAASLPVARAEGDRGYLEGAEGDDIVIWELGRVVVHHGTTDDSGAESCDSGSADACPPKGGWGATGVSGRIAGVAHVCHVRGGRR